MFEWILIALGFYVLFGRVSKLEGRVDTLYSRAMKGAFLFALILAQTCAIAAEPTPANSMVLDELVRRAYYNPDGSCVQCSIGMAGAWCNDPNAATLLWDTVYGKAERLGSWPSRVEAYCDKRGIRAYNVTGESVNDTIPWLIWAAKTGRYAAFGAGQAHFQTLYGYDEQSRTWFVCNNQTPARIDRYTHDQFVELHRQSGPWCVILEKPSSAPPQLVNWIAR